MPRIHILYHSIKSSHINNFYNADRLFMNINIQQKQNYQYNLSKMKLKHYLKSSIKLITRNRFTIRISFLCRGLTISSTNSLHISTNKSITYIYKQIRICSIKHQTCLICYSKSWLIRYRFRKLTQGQRL